MTTTSLSIETADFKKEELQRLLELYPVEAIRTVWPDVKAPSKEARCQRIVQSEPLSSISTFAQTYLPQCKQHVHVYERPAGWVPPEAIIDGVRLLSDASRTLYANRLTQSVFVVGQNDTAVTQSISFLRPVLVELRPGYIVVRVVTVEKATATYFRERAWVRDKGLDVTAVVNSISAGLTVADLHKGIKALWASGVIDSPDCTFVNAKRTTNEKMHDRRGLKQTLPDVYAAMVSRPLERMVFDLLPPADGLERDPVATFIVEPSGGLLNFPRYSEGTGGTDGVIRKILEANSAAPAAT